MAQGFAEDLIEVDRRRTGRRLFHEKSFWWPPAFVGALRQLKYVVGILDEEAIKAVLDGVRDPITLLVEPDHFLLVEARSGDSR